MIRYHVGNKTLERKKMIIVICILHPCFVHGPFRLNNILFFLKKKRKKKKEMEQTNIYRVPGLKFLR